MPPAFPDALAALRARFLEQLPERLAGIRSALDQLTATSAAPDASDDIRRQLHSLAGAAGSFGFVVLTEHARAMEAMLGLLVSDPSPEVLERFRAAFSGLEAVARGCVEGGAQQLLPPPPPLRRATPLVWFLEDDPAQAALCRERLEAEGFELRVFHAPDTLLAAWQDSETARPDALLLDLVFEGMPAGGAELLSRLKAAGPVPPVAFLSVRGDLDAHLAALRAGASRYLVKPAAPGEVAEILFALTGRQPRAPYRVLLVDDEPLLLEAQAAVLRGAGMEVEALSEPLRLFEVLNRFNPDVVVLDVYMPGASGPELAAVLRERDTELSLPILFLSAETDISQQLSALALGGDDFLVKPVRPDHLVAAVTARARRARQSSALRRRLEALLYEREREHLALDQHAIVSVADAAGNITYTNDKFCVVSGYSRGELLGRNHRILKSGLHPPAFYRQLWQTIADGRVWQGEICNRRKDGSLYWVASTIVPFLGSDGRPYQYVSIRTDITRLKETERALEAHKERLRRGQIYANIGTWDWNIQTGELFWTERIAPLFGYPEGELETTYENFLNAVHPEDRQRVIDAVNACVERDVPYEIEHRVVWPDGTVRWLLERGAVIRDDYGSPLQMLGVVQDIHDRKQAELALAESEARFRGAFESSSIGFALVSLEGRWLKVNPALCRIIGYGEAELLATDFQTITHPDDLAADLALVGQLLKGEIPHYQMEKRYITKAGEVVWILLNVSLVRDAGGQPLYFVSQINDIDARKRAEQALIVAREEAERANQAKSEFLSSMSHELRTPLNAVLGFTQLLQYDPATTPAQQDALNEIRKAGQHLLELINEVLDLAKIEAGRIDLSLEGVELCAVVEDVITFMLPLAATRGIRVHHAEMGGVVVRADRTRLKQVLLNLLSNAVKYNRPDGEVAVTVNAPEAGWIRVTVRDTGPGIAAEKLEQLFEPFNRLGAEATEVEGTGIGLTITRQLVEMMGGRIGVESRLGEGSTFWIELPRDTVAVAAEAPVPPGAARPGEPVAPERLVLYVEDNPSNIRLVTQILARRPHLHLVTAHTPELGIEVARARRPDLVLLDISMPGMNGYEVLSVLKTDPLTRDISVVALTANAMPSDVERGLRAGFADYLTKPIDVPRFLQTLDRLLAEKQS